MAEGAASAIRWRLTDDDGGRPELFATVERLPGTRELAGLEFLHVTARSVINRVPEASRMPFRYTVNPYRGCSHACVYCFARPSHEYLNLNRGSDFDTKIVVKVNAVECIKAELRSPRWRGDLVALGTNTDPYQPCEGRYRLTRGIIEALTDAGNPFSIVTKSTLVARDIDVLAHAARSGGVHVDISVGCLDRDVWRATEPHTPSPQRRLAAVTALGDAGVSCGVFVAPVLPGISDSDDQLDRLARACVEAGARSITTVPLHLRSGVREHYLSWLHDHRPDAVVEYAHRYRGAYLPAQERRDLSRRVQEFAAAHRRRCPVPLRPPPPSPVRSRHRPPVPTPAPDPQMRLM